MTLKSIVFVILLSGLMACSVTKVTVTPTVHPVRDSHATAAANATAKASELATARAEYDQRVATITATAAIAEAVAIADSIDTNTFAFDCPERRLTLEGTFGMFVTSLIPEEKEAIRWCFYFTTGGMGIIGNSDPEYMINDERLGTLLPSSEELRYYRSNSDDTSTICRVARHGKKTLQLTFPDGRSGCWGISEAIPTHTTQLSPETLLEACLAVKAEGWAYNLNVSDESVFQVRENYQLGISWKRWFEFCKPVLESAR